MEGFCDVFILVKSLQMGMRPLKIWNLRGWGGRRYRTCKRKSRGVMIAVLPGRASRSFGDTRGTCWMYVSPRTCISASIFILVIRKGSNCIVIQSSLVEPRFFGHQSMCAPGSSMDHVRLW